MMQKESPSVASNANTENTNDSNGSSRVPPNAPIGGVWGTMKYNGETSKKRNRIGCALLLLPGLVMMTCPKDSKDAYAVWEERSGDPDIYLYDTKGKVLGKRKRFNWSPADETVM